MIDWKQPLFVKRTGATARWLGTVRRKDGLNFVVATQTANGDEEVGCFTIYGCKLDTGKYDLTNEGGE